MTVEKGTLLRAALLPRGFETLLPHGEIDPLALRIARKQRLSRSALFILAAGEARPTPQEALGMLYFTQVIKTEDDALDRNITHFSTPKELRDYLLTQEIAGAPHSTVQDALEKSLACYSLDKQKAISSFLDEMVEVHLQNPQRGTPGSYSYQDAMEYRKSTNEPLLETFAKLTDTHSNRDRYRAIAHTWQLIEDGLDWTEDAQEQSKNLFLGMATDTWHERGKLEGQDIDHLLKTLGRWQRGRMFDFRVNALLGIKSPHLKNTREKYKKEIMDQMPAIGEKGARALTTITHLVF